MTSATGALPFRAAAPARGAFLQDVLAGLRSTPKELPCKWFYDAEGSRLFEAICALPEYYLTRTELGILRDRLPEIARLLGPRCLVIEYGSGSGIKTRLLLEHLADPVAWVPIDISRSALLASAAGVGAAHPGVQVLPVCADYTGDPRLPLPARPAARRVVFFPGSTIGNFAPREARAFLAGAARTVGTGGAVLLGVDLVKDAAILEPAYDDAQGVTARFNLNLLARARRELGADFDLSAFRHRARYDAEQGRVEMHLVSERAQVVRVAGARFRFAAGEAMRTECSYKWREDELAGHAASAGLAVRAVFTDPRRWFAVALLEAPGAGLLTARS